MSSVSLNNSKGDRQPTTGESLNTLMKSLKAGGRSVGPKPDTSETGSSNGGNNSDNSALVSLGNTSFGFNFDSEESNSKEGQNDSNEDSDGNVQSNNKLRPSGTNNSSTTKKRGGGSRSDTLVTASSISSSNLSSSHHGSINGENINMNAAVEQQQAAADAVASLESIVRSYPKLQNDPSVFTEADNAEAQRQALERKRKAEQFDSNNNKDADSGGYNTDDDEEEEAQSNSRASRNDKNGGCGGSTKSTSNKRKYKAKENESKREERNQREKERSFRISKQITELRDLLSSGGVVVPKGTKSSVLTEAATYIRMLQQHQYRSEM